MTTGNVMTDGAVTRARATFKELRGFAILFVVAALVGGGGMIVYSFTGAGRSTVFRTTLFGTGLVMLIAGLWIAVLARAMSVVVELLLEFHIREPGGAGARIDGAR